MLGGLIALMPLRAVAQNPASDEPQNPVAALFEETCATCHNSGQSGRTPSRFMLGSLTPRAIVASLEDGLMRVEGEPLSREQKVALAELITGRTYTEVLLPAAAYCAERGFADIDVDGITYMGFGGNPEATGFIEDDRAGLTADQVPDLELKWAFAMPDATQVRTKPTVVGDIVIVGDMYGGVYAIEADSGCVRWDFSADAGIRGAILVGDSAGGDTLGWFVDFRTSVYALDITTGELAWKTKVGRHSEASNTGSPAIHDGKLIVPVSSMEVVTAMDPTYQCCTSSGAVAAVDARTGKLLWYTPTIAQSPEPTVENAIGIQNFGPSGATVWSSPTIDAKRGLVYVGTGENLTHPTTKTSDAVLALDIETGAIAWSFQGTQEDAFTMACTTPKNRQNCPGPTGPDLDFGMAPIIVTRMDGRQILVAGQKSGVVWALDPDDAGKVLWSTQIGKGSALGGIHWGMTTDGDRVYAANAGRPDAVIVDVSPDIPVSPGLYALDLMGGEIEWSAASPTDTCLGKDGCRASNSAAPSMIDGVVFAGGLDGYIRAHSSDDGSIIWEYDTTGEHETINGVPGRGGAIDGPAPVVANGMLFVNSGYGSFGQMPGNVLLAFGLPE